MANIRAPVMDGDEVWEGTDSDIDSEEDIGTPRAVHASDVPPSLQMMSPKKMTAAPLPEAPPQLAASAAKKKPVPTIVAPVVPQQRGLVGLLGHLREDNDRLREALLAAQTEAEMMQRQRESEGEAAESHVDFGQLLALVKDFGDGLGGFDDGGAACNAAEDDWWGGPEADEGAGVISMATPRGSENGDVDEADSEGEAEVARLRQELETSRLEAAQLREELELRDAELAALQGSDVEC